MILYNKNDKVRIIRKCWRNCKKCYIIGRVAHILRIREVPDSWGEMHTVYELDIQCDKLGSCKFFNLSEIKKIIFSPHRNDTLIDKNNDRGIVRKIIEDKIFVDYSKYSHLDTFVEKDYIKQIIKYKGGGLKCIFHRILLRK